MPHPLAIERFKMLDTAVKRCLVEAGAALEEIRDTELYIAGGHSSFKGYCESLGRNYHWAWKQMNAAKIARQNPQIENVATAEAVAKISIPKRRQVIQEALQQSDGKLSAPAIKKAAAAIPERHTPKDGTGLVIPPEIRHFWARNEEAGHLLGMISKVRITLEKGAESRDLLFRFTDLQGCISKLKMIYEELQCLKSYAVCPKCNGVTFENCPDCRGRGTLPQFWWNMQPEEIRKLRE